MKRLTWLVAIAFVIVMIAPVFAAPLFPDVPENHWARDAVADLAAKGIIEGYPDGTFKGDRAATRWEMAMALQRFLAKMEAEHAKFATKADLEALRALVNNLKDELDALGVRVKNLEENVSALDKRVTELERITFEGDFTTRFVTIGIRNSGRTGTAWNTDVGGINAVNPASIGKIGTVDLFSGRPYVNGAGFTARARLGVKVKVSKDMNAGIRFAAFTSMGDRYIDAYWGVSAPSLSNVFAGNSVGSAQDINNSPWTRMTLDNFWIEHKPSKTNLMVGSINKTNMDDCVLQRIPNPGIDGRDVTKYAEMEVGEVKKGRVSTLKYWEDDDSYIPFYGIRVNGKTKVFTNMAWEVMYSKLPDDPTGVNRIFVNMAGVQNVSSLDNLTAPYMFGLNLDWKIKDKGNIKLNFMRVSENLNNGQSTNSFAGVPNFQDLNGDGNTDFIAMNGRGNLWAWTDPWSYRNTARNKRPMRSNTDVAATIDQFIYPYISQQGQTSFGISVNYRFDPSNIRVSAAYAGSQYKPSLESGFTADGNHFRLGVGWTNKKNNLDLDLEYIATDPYYDSFQLYYPNVGNMVEGGLPNCIALYGTASSSLELPVSFAPMSGNSYPGIAYQLHDSSLYPNNRNGLRFGGEFRFPNGNGRINLRLAFLEQNLATEQHRDVTGQYFGMQPGFIDSMFGRLAADANTGAYETPKGKTSHIGGGIEYKFAPSAFSAGVQYDSYHYGRDSGWASNTTVARTNEVDLRYDVFKLGLAYKISSKFTLNGGYDYGSMTGYHSVFAWDFPAYNAGDTVVDTYQSVPHIGFDYDLTKDTTWNFDTRFINTTDKLSGNRTGNNSPQSYNGLQLTTTFKLKF
ncbi:MAG: S-layer homology domain-containing protein [Candidatus Eremiobacteraeota bacterium]|nr:S-layer homology domain-containing protein [Candidatus Eremiobacteraeota bacterium]